MLLQCKIIVELLPCRIIVKLLIDQITVSLLPLQTYCSTFATLVFVIFMKWNYYSTFTMF